MGFKQPAFVEHIIPKVGGDKRSFGDILEGDIVSKSIGKRRTLEPAFEEDVQLELMAIRRSFRRRVKRLRRKLSRVSEDEHPGIITQMDHMHSILALHPKKQIKLIEVAAVLRNLRKKPDFLIGAAKLHAIHRRYGRKPVENAKKHIKNKK